MPYPTGKVLLGAITLIKTEWLIYLYSLLAESSFYLMDTINASVVFNMIHLFCIHTQFLCINIIMGISLFSCFADQRFFFLQAVTHHVFFFFFKNKISIMLIAIVQSKIKYRIVSFTRKNEINKLLRF